jgi:hypothetical protein
MGPDQPNIIASIRLYKTEEGGRKYPTRPHRHGFIFGVNGLFFEAMMYHPHSVAQGASADNVGISFLNPDLLRGEIEVGSRFVIHELGTVGEGTIKKIVSLEKRPPPKSA